MGLNTLLEISHQYGSDPRFVLAGGGNTSFKDGDILYIKSSGVSLADITAEQFVKMSRPSLTHMWNTKYSENEALREAEVLRDMLNARLPGEEDKRPSVETLLHHLFSQPYVLHVHPAVINGLCCGQNGERVMRLLFHEAVWVPSTRPGYTLAVLCRKLIDRYINRYARYPKLLFLENHGIFFAANTKDELDTLVQHVFAKLRGLIQQLPDFSPVPIDVTHTTLIAPALRMLYGGQNAKVRFTANRELLHICADEKSFAPLSMPFTPDQIVYCKTRPLYVPYRSAEKEQIAILQDTFRSFVQQNGYPPVVVFVQGIGMFTCGFSQKEVDTAAAIETDAVAISVYASSFGGPKHMEEDLIRFIAHWEAESYRANLIGTSGAKTLIHGKIALVADACAPLGRAIAAALVRGGSVVTLADRNQKEGERLLSYLKKIRPEATIVFSCIDCAEEKALREHIDEIVLQYGGLDLVVQCATQDKEQDLEKCRERSTQLFRLLTTCAARPMGLQHEISKQQWADIIKIGAPTDNLIPAARKYLDYGIKVNAIYPSLQELTPMGRSIRDEDITKALVYLIEQQFETAMTLPVAGGYRLKS